MHHYTGWHSERDCDKERGQIEGEDEREGERRGRRERERGGQKGDDWPPLVEQGERAIEGGTCSLLEPWDLNKP